MITRFAWSLVFMAAMCLPASAAFQLDSRYQDNDGDLIADIPADKADQVDPSTLIFAYTPVEDPAVYVDVWKGFLDHMSEVTGKRVQRIQAHAAEVTAIAMSSRVAVTGGLDRVVHVWRIADGRRGALPVSLRWAVPPKVLAPDLVEEAAAFLATEDVSVAALTSASATALRAHQAQHSLED